MVERVACLWCPDWAVVAVRSRRPELHDTPVVVVERGERGLVVRAASPEARAEGVTTGLRRREAESRCPGLVVVESDPHVEARTFERIALAVEAFTPRLVLEQPGALLFPTRGPSRYFRGDATLARRVLDAVDVPSARLGVADGYFAARLAARRAASSSGTGAEIVAPGESAVFLSEWPVDVLDDPELASLLHRLGLRTLGAFAELPAATVLGRFGPDGQRRHRLARGLDELVAPPAPPPPELTEIAELDPPAIHVEAAAFVAHGLADRLLARLEALGLACTRVMIEAETEHGERLTRCWRHEGALTPAALAARVRWQLEGWLSTDRGDDDLVTAGLALLRLVPDEVIPATGRQLGFWGGDPAATDRAGRALARVQRMLGHPAVVTPVPQGGRTPGERVRWVPWGDPREPVRPCGPPWPGTLPDPAPARVLDPPAPAELLDADGRPVVVSGRGEPTAVPARLQCPRLGRTLDGGGGPIDSWTGPWPHDARWWDGPARRRGAYWRVTVADVTCLVVVTGGRAAVEAIYD